MIKNICPPIVLIFLLFLFGCVSDEFLNKLVVNEEQTEIETYKIKINKPTDFGLVAGVVINVDPNGEEVDIEWKGFNFNRLTKYGSKETIKIISINESYFVKTTGNYEILINGKTLKFKSNKSVQVKIGAGVSIIKAKSYKDSIKIHELIN